jgi:hypothetical protein
LRFFGHCSSISYGQALFGAAYGWGLSY